MAESERLKWSRKRVIYKRDYNREAEEVNRVAKLVCNVENGQMLETLRGQLEKTRTNLNEMYFGLMDTVNEEKEEDLRWQEELLQERDAYLLNIDRAVGICLTFNRKLEGAAKRQSLNASTVAAAAPAPVARFPKVNVPTFDGNLRKFLDFKAMFENLVHNDEDVPIVRKMHYLKESLIGEASRTLSSITISPDGYKEAWGRVLTKYDNKRVIIHTHFNDLFSADRIKSDQHLRSLLDQMDCALRGLRACGENTDNWSSILSYMLYMRIDNKTKSDFDNQVVSNAEYYNFKEFMKFCENRACNVEARKIEEPVAATPQNRPAQMETRRSFLTSRIACFVCQGPHLLIDCSEFVAKTPAERLKLIQANKLCVNCFSKMHNGPTCPSQRSCRICQQRHHYLLHLGDAILRNVAGAGSGEPTNAVQKADTATALTTTGARSKGVIVLPSAKIRFQSGRTTGEARALMDSCSQPTLISDLLVKRMKLRTYLNASNKPVRGVGFQMVGTPRSCKLTLYSRVNGFKIDIEADVIPATAIPYSLTAVGWSHKEYDQIKRLSLADTAFYSCNPCIEGVDIILGAQYVEQCLLNETKSLQSLTLRNTQFGWTLIGEFPAIQGKITKEKSNELCCFTTSSIEYQVAQFLDTGGSVTQNENTEFCETHFRENHARAADGKFVVKLPFVFSPTLLGSTKRCAAAVLNHTQRTASPELASGYAEFLQEYESLGHMTLVPFAANEPEYLIPHHAVVRPESSTTRTRVVFNASAPSDSGYSLNDILAVGPQLQPELIDALIRFRTYAVAFSADIAKMYRCVWVHPSERRFQRILWRDAPTNPIRTYELNTITYGTAPASFLAVRCLFELSYSIEKEKPNAAKAIREHFYMDDLMSGAASVEDAKLLLKEIHETLEQAGFLLRKYQASSAELLNGVDPELLLQTEAPTIGSKWYTAILGIKWNRDEDTLSVKCGKSETIKGPRLTKRQMLSEVSKSFDPLGLIAPVTVRAKLLVKRAWSEKIGWDEEISDELAETVKKYLSEIAELNDFAIERPYSSENSKQIELIGFCDASQDAYCAALYTRCSYEDSSPVIRLCCSKTRVAPNKPSTIPRLELQAALLLAELAERIRKLLSLKVEEVTLHSDSQVVLAWLSKPLSRWSVYVRNRIVKIQNQFPVSRWRFVQTASNPADLATRGLSSKELLRCKNDWLYASKWSAESERVNSSIEFVPETTIELEKVKSCRVVMAMGSADVSFVDRFKSYKQIINVLGRVITFVQGRKAARSIQAEYPLNKISISSRARTAAILLLQVQHFSAELLALQEGRKIPSRSELKLLDPFIDELGVLRVRGRLANSSFSDSKKFPIILPRKCSFLKLYIRYLHETFCHAGKGFIMSFIVSEFWVCGGLHSCVKSVINQCVVCARYRAETFSQIMGQLPATRVEPSRPFSNAGLDFCGPFNCKCLGHRSSKFNKIYVCIFICMATRAVHLEVVSSLSTAHFLMALHRFVARRGLPATLHSDCGTNFVGASRYLDLSSDEVQKDQVTRSVKWIFNPPRAPHRGGVWEAAVKSAKTHASRVIGNQVLNYEEYCTLFTRIESILNSRPLCYRVVPQVGEEVLTPGHFLVGSFLYSIPEPEELKLPLWRRYELLRGLLQSFWKHWRVDYLNMMQRKSKWQKSEVNVEIGRVVLLKTESSPGSWPLAIVEETFPDSNGIVRTVTVRVSSGALLRRDVRYLVKVPLEREVDSLLEGGSVNTSAPVEEKDIVVE